MQTKPRIIEFEGVAGCGKSTLCGELKQELENKGFRTWFLNEKPFSSFFYGYKWFHLHRYFQTFSLKALARSVKLMCGLKCFGEIKRIKQLYDADVIYAYIIKHQPPNTIVLCDQSIIQTIVSLWGYNKEKVFSKKEEKAISEYLSGSLLTEGFFCYLPIEENLKRIRKRARNHGRLNLVDDDEVLLRMLNNNLTNLRNVISIKESTGAKEYFLSMHCEPKELAESVMVQIGL